MNFVLEFERKSETSRKYPISDDVRRGDAEPLRRPQDRFSFSWKYFSCFSQKNVLAHENIVFFSLDFSNFKYFHLNDSPEAILSSGIYTAL